MRFRRGRAPRSSWKPSARNRPGWRTGDTLLVVSSAGDHYLSAEGQARVKIDRMLALAGWVVQDPDRVSLGAGRGVAVREFIGLDGRVVEHQSSTTSTTAILAADWSTMDFLAEKVATRDCRARLLMARGRPREAWWMTTSASSENRVYIRWMVEMQTRAGRAMRLDDLDAVLDGKPLQPFQEMGRHPLESRRVGRDLPVHDLHAEQVASRERCKSETA